VARGAVAAWCRPLRRRALPVVAVVIAAGALAACDEGAERSAACDGKREPDGRRSGEGRPTGDGLRSPEGLMIRDWLMALKRGDYGHAAMFFAPGAVIDQGRPFRLETRAAARLFNAGLPCHADLIALEDAGAAVLATFRLLPGPGGPCAGRVQVRYTIKRGRFTEWRQLPGERREPPEPAGPVV
jgi:hypothetical protein